MILDIIVWSPEAFFLISLLRLIWYGSGPLDNPVTEKVYSPAQLAGSVLAPKGRTRMNSPVNENEQPISGPLHIQSHLNMWAMTICFLMVCLLWNCSLISLMPGRVFSRDFGSIYIQSFLWGQAGIFLLLQNPWQKWAGLVHLEYVYLTLLFLLGVHLLCYTVDLMGLYVCLELQSFSIVVLCRMNYTTPYAIEAGMKYFLLRAFSSRLLLLGISLLYSQIAHTELSSVQELLTVLVSSSTEGNYTELLTMLGLWFVGLGLLWKLAQAPLHMWAADVYMGAWSSVTLMISTLPKVQVLFFWARCFHSVWSIGFGSTLLQFFRSRSFIIGMFAPLAQFTLKRLLAFSSVGNMGLLLMPFCTNRIFFTQRLWVHLFLYIVSSMVVWRLIMWPFYRTQSNTQNVQTNTSVYVSGPQYVWDLTNLNQISRAQAQAWAVAMLSFQGLPPVQGFLGKLGLFWYSLSNNMYALVSVALISTLVSRVYYLRILKVSYVDRPNSWGSYGTFRPSQAYLVQIGVRLLIVIMWHVQPLALCSHLLQLAISYNFLFFFI